MGTGDWEAYHDDAAGVVTLHSSDGECRALVVYSVLARRWNWFAGRGNLPAHTDFHRETALTATFTSRGNIRNHRACPRPLIHANAISLPESLPWDATEMFSHPLNASPDFLS